MRAFSAKHPDPEKQANRTRIVTILCILLVMAWLYLFNFMVQPSFTQENTDDHTFYTLSHSMGLYNLLYDQYTTWCGRLSALTLSMVSAMTGPVLYWITNPLILLLSAYSMSRYLSEKVNPRYLLFFLLAFGMLNQFVISSSIFWFTGSYAYAVPVSMGLFALIPYADSYFRGKDQMSVTCLILSAVAGLVAVLGDEQVTAVAVGVVFFFHLSQLINKKRLSFTFYILSAVIIAGAVVIFICPGSMVRWKAELSWFPGFDTLSFVSRLKVDLYFFFDSIVNHMTFLLIALSCIPIFGIKRFNGVYKIIAYLFSLQFILFIITLLFSNQPAVTSLNLTNLGFLMTYYNTPLNEILASASLKEVMACLFRYSFWGVYLVFLVLLSCKAAEKQIFTFLMFMAGFATLFMMFLSPTIFASKSRVFYVCSILFIIIIGFAAKKLHLIESKKCLIVLAVLFAVTFGMLGLHWLSNGYYVIL